MKIVVIGGTGRVGSKLVQLLREQKHQVIAGSPKTGVNTISGEGLTESLHGASVVVDVSNSPSIEASAVLKFFETSTKNQLAAELQAGVRHHVALSVVGTDHLLDSGYFRAKMAQEDLIKASSIPYTIVRATQFFEFISVIADAATVSTTVRVPSVCIRPLAADDAARAVADVATVEPVHGIVDVAGPEEFLLDDLLRQLLRERGDDRSVIADPNARYFGASLSQRTLVPAAGTIVGTERFDDWLRRSAPDHRTDHHNRRIS